MSGMDPFGVVYLTKPHVSSKSMTIRSVCEGGLLVEIRSSLVLEMIVEMTGCR